MAQQTMFATTQGSCHIKSQHPVKCQGTMMYSYSLSTEEEKTAGFIGLPGEAV